MRGLGTGADIWPATAARAVAKPATAVELAGLHAVLWLVVGNAVGTLLALLLSWPALGSLLGPLGYGRWVPLHLDVQLYGWCSLPLVALLLRAYGARDGGARAAVGLWSAALAAGCVSWLAGQSSGKLFLEWTGPSRLLLPLAMGILVVVLLRALVRDRARPVAGSRAEVLRDPRPLRPGAFAGRVALLLLLAPLPFVLYWAAGPNVYPPFNPDSGGATGSSLLGSSLGIVAVLLLVPVLARLPQRAAALSPRARRAIPGVLGLHFVAFALAGHGARSHRDLGQRLALVSLALWVPLVVSWLRSYHWPDAARPWLAAAGVWAGVLLVTSLVTFQPGVLERLKFTNGLVGHAHLAMAGTITSFHGALLAAVHRGDRLALALRPRWAFVLWHGGCALQIGALTWVAVLEAADPGLLFRPDLAAQWGYHARLLGGAAMLAASTHWLQRAWQALGPAAEELGVAAS